MSLYDTPAMSPGDGPPTTAPTPVVKPPELAPPPQHEATAEPIAMAEVAPSVEDECTNCEADAKKRPLSISSTSSSSSSSLPRQPRKKVAAGSTIAETWVDDHGDRVLGNHLHGNHLHNNHLHSTHVHGYKDVDERTDKVTMDTPVLCDVSSSVSLLERVVAEILETERKYVADLRDIIQGYQQTLLKRDCHLIPDEDVMLLFGNIEDIYQFNSEFVLYLERCSSDPIQVAQCFVQHGQGFLVYGDYCTNYPRAVEVLTRCMCDPVQADIFKHQQMALQHGLPLGSYLLKPVQRILKYHLLLQNMLNNYDETRDGRTIIQQALESMTKMADTINEMKRKHERLVHVQEIQSVLYGWEGADLATFGDLVLEDSFRMYGAKALRHLFLFEKGLFITKRKEDGTLALKDTILCSNLMLIESIPKEPLSFHVIPFDNPRLQYTVQSKCLDQKRRWCQELKHLILENYSAAIPDKAKELVMMLGKSREEEGLDTSRVENSDSGKKQHNAPEYLERRRGRRKSTSLIPDFGLLKTKKGTRKSEPSSPTASPRIRRRSDIANFPSHAHKSPSKSRLAGVSCEESLLEEETGTNSAQPTPVVSHREPRQGNRLLRSESRSLESLHEALRQAAKDTDRDHVPDDSPGIGSFDDSSHRAERLSQVLNSDDGCDPEDFIPVVDLPPDHSPNSRPVSRVDSLLITKMRKKFIKQASAPASPFSAALMSGDESGQTTPVRESPDRVSRPSTIDERDDGYVNVVFTIGRGYELNDKSEPESIYSNVVRVNRSHENIEPIMEESQGDTQYGNYVKLDLTASPTGVASTLPDVVPSQAESPSDVCHRHTAIDSSQSSTENSDVSPNTLDNYGKVSVSECCTLRSQESKCSLCQQRNRYSGQNRGANNSCWGSPLCHRVNLNGNYLLGSPSGHRHNISSGAESLMSSCASLVTVKSNSCASKETHSAAVRDSSCDSAKNVSVQCDSDCVYDDPWIPRSPISSPTSPIQHAMCSEETKVKKSCSKSKTPKNKITKPPVMTLKKSNSFTSTDDLRGQLSREDDYVKGHRRQTSDTLVFSNRRAFVASSLSSAIKRDQELQGRIARLATPPREMGPDDLVREVECCRERGRVISRYATPPRQLMDKNGLMVSPPSTLPLEIDTTDSGTSFVTSTNSPMLPSRTMVHHSGHKSSPVSPRGPSSAVSCDGRDTWSSLPSDRTSTPQTSHGCPQRAGSFHGTSVHSTRTTSPSSRSIFSPLSPSSPAINDGFVDSLKNAVLHLTSRFTGRGHSLTSPKSTDSSPARTPRTRSAEDMFRIGRPRTPDSRSPSKHGKDKEKRKEKKQHRFVYQLARVYSERVKGKSRHLLERAQSTRESSVKKELKELLKENEPGSLTLGERIATAKPIVLGTYTLPRHRPPRPRKNQQNSQDDTVTSSEEVHMVENSDQNTEATPTETPEMNDSAEIDHGVTSLENSVADTVDNSRLQLPEQTSFMLNAELLSLLKSSAAGGSDPTGEEENSESEGDDCGSEFFYEQRFVQDLEGSQRMSFCSSADNLCESLNFGAASGAVDAGEFGAAESGMDGDVDPGDPAGGFKMSIKDTVKLMEQRSRSKPVPRIEVKQKEKAQGIQEILKTLEAVTSPGSVPGSPVISPNSSAASSSDLAFKTVRERTRELVECATLTRIRQNSYSVADDYTSPYKDREDEFRSKSEGSSPTKKGLDLQSSQSTC